VVWQEPPWYGTVCQVVWEDGGGNPASYPILSFENKYLFETNILTTLRIIDIWESTLRKKKQQIDKSAKRRR